METISKLSSTEFFPYKSLENNKQEEKDVASENIQFIDANLRADLLTFPELLGYRSLHQNIISQSEVQNPPEMVGGMTLSRENARDLKNKIAVVHMPEFRDITAEKKKASQLICLMRNILCKVNAVSENVWDRVKDTVKFADKITATTVVIHASVLQESGNPKKFAAYLSELSSKYGVNIAIENCVKKDFSADRQEIEPWFYNPLTLNQKLKEWGIADSRLKFCLDISHANLSGLDIVQLLKDLQKDGVDIADKIVNVHLVDCRKDQEKDALLPCSGDIGSQKTGEFLQLLKDAGYKNGLTLELEPRELGTGGLSAKLNLVLSTFKRFSGETIGVSAKAIQKDIQGNVQYLNQARRNLLDAMSLVQG
ncbi:MAG: sugar phosphate isomerase/epimerase [Candidatus Jacksonbacteria bacterium]